MKKEIEHTIVATDEGMITITQPYPMGDDRFVSINPEIVGIIIRWLEEARIEIQDTAKK